MDWKGLDEPCPGFMRCLGEVFPTQEKIDRFLRMMGYSLSGDTSQGRCFNIAQVNLFLAAIPVHTSSYICSEFSLFVRAPGLAKRLTTRSIICWDPNTRENEHNLMSMMPRAKLFFFRDEDDGQDLIGGSERVNELRKEKSGILACLVRAGIEHYRQHHHQQD